MTRVLLAVAAGLALADASVVTLGLPAVLGELDADVNGAAAVLGVYTLVLAVALPVAERVRRGVGTRGTGVAGLLLFAGAGVACGAASSLEFLVAARAVQAVGGAAALVAAFDVLGRGRLWIAAAVFGTAAGPALGGALTEWLDWRAIFYAQTPVGVAAAVSVLLLGRGASVSGAGRADADAPSPEAPLGTVAPLEPRPASPAARAEPDGPLWSAGADRARRRHPETPAAESTVAAAAPPAAAARPSDPMRVGALVALALVSAALTGVLFLLVLLLVAGWSVSPLAAAAVVSVLPLAALAGARVPGTPRARAAGGAVLLGAGILSLAFLPDDRVVWTLAPQALAGVGMGMALPALAGGLLRERTPADAARLLAVRHLGITVALAVLAPITADRLDTAEAETRERGAALVLDAPLPVLDKLQLAGPLVAALDPVDPRGALTRAFDEQAPLFADSAEERRAYATLRRRADEALVLAVDDALRVAFLICGALALFAAPAVGRPRWTLLALAVPVAMALARPGLAPEPVTIADPCEERPGTSGGGGLTDAVAGVALAALDDAACEFGSSREELVLALADDDLARDYEREHGVDPRDAAGLLGGVLGTP